MQNTNSLPQRLFCLSHDEAIDACSRIGFLVSRLVPQGGIAALSMERALYTALYEEVVQMNATPAAVEYIENRRKEISLELDTMRSCAPDLFDGWCGRNGIDQLLQQVPQLVGRIVQ